jgi:ABC-type polysaccharide/polyol phosphate transport system ATPase subunit
LPSNSEHLSSVPLSSLRSKGSAARSDRIHAVEDPPIEAEAELPAIEVEDLHASYRITLGSSSLAADIQARFGRRHASTRIVPALNGVSFTVPAGSVLGVIGRNGAGKSTMLRAMAGILPPTAGRIVARGRIAALLSSGVGFNRDLTGRENIELGSLAVGLPEDRLQDLAESIAQFAELGEYLDLPVRTYSSGMNSRLGFAVAAHLDPEILLIDEALGGGDSKFQEKCANKMSELCSQGRTIVLVTHGLKLVETLADSCLWMQQGKVVMHGGVDEVLADYRTFCQMKDNADQESDEEA